MKRIYKFRAWDGESLSFYPTIWDGKVWNALEDREEKGVELMQFTGLFDKNGVEIYEGDIFKSKQEYADVKSDIWQVVFDEGQFCGESKRQGLVHLNYWSKSEIEKIGDIYSNPELL